MEITREKLYKRIESIFTILNGKVAKLIWAVAMLVSLVCDVIPCGYASEGVQEFFSYEPALVVAIVVVIWTFTTSMFVYCLGKADQRYYGIHVMDVFMKGLQDKEVYGVALSMFGEIVLLILASVAELEITMFVIALFQCYLMLYIILMVLNRTSRQFVLDRIEEEVKHTYQIQNAGNREPAVLFGCMLHNIDYRSHNDTEKLLRILRVYNDNFKAQIESCRMDEKGKKYINDCSMKIVKHLSQGMDEVSCYVRSVIGEWYEGSCLEIKQGILMYAVEKIMPYNFLELDNLLDSEREEYRGLHIWTMVYNIYMEGFEGEAWRTDCTRYLLGKIKGFGAKDIRLAISFWRQITGNSRTYKLLKYIFRYGVDEHGNAFVDII